MSMPLTGIRVLDFTQVLGGPIGTRILGDLGAEVIKIEQPNMGDPSRSLGPYFLNGESAYFLGFNRNKKGITLNLRSQKGREVFRKLVELSDIVFDNFRPSVLPKLGLDYETLHNINPRIISCSLSGFGSDGPYQNRPAFDGVVQAMSGAMSVTGERGRPPVYLGFPMGDIGGGYAAAMGAITALFARERTGLGQRVDVSMLDVLIAFQGHLGQFYLASGSIPDAIGSGHPSNVPAGAYLAKDGKYIQVHCTTPIFYEKLARLLANQIQELQYLPDDIRFATPDDRVKHREELDNILAQAFITKTSEEWSRLFVEWDVTAAPINNIEEALSDPQVQFRNMVVDIEHSKAGKYKSAGNPIKLGQEERFEPAPLLGEHTHQVLSGLLGYSDETIDLLGEEQVI